MAARPACLLLFRRGPALAAVWRGYTGSLGLTGAYPVTDLLGQGVPCPPESSLELRGHPAGQKTYLIAKLPAQSKYLTSWRT